MTLSRFVARRVTWTSVGALLACGLFACGSGPVQPPDGEPDLDRVVAEVNGVPIPARRLEEVVEAEKLRRHVLDGDPTPEDESQLRAESLELLIRAELLFQAARSSGIDIDPAEIERQLATVRSQFDSEEQFDSYLREAGETREHLRAEAERRLLTAAYARTVTADFELDEARARQMYQQEKSRFREADQARVAHIVVRVKPDASPERKRAARDKIQQAAARLAAGEGFADVARAYSESPFAERGGDMGFFARGRALPEFEKVAFELPVGATSDVFETRHGFNLIRASIAGDGDELSYDEVRTGLLMVLARERNDSTLRRHIDELRDAAEIEIFVP